MKVNKKIN